MKKKPNFNDVLKSIMSDDAKADQSYRAVVLVDNHDLQSFVSVWPSVKRFFDVDFAGEFVDDFDRTEIWDWLWKHIEIVASHECKLIGISSRSFESLFDQAKASHMIYPNGYINPWASQLMQRRVASEMMRGLPKSKIPKKTGD